MRLDRSVLIRHAKIGAAAVALVALLGGAFWMGGAMNAPTETAQHTVAHPEPTPPAPEPVSVPMSAAGARSSGAGGQSWMSGDPAQLGADFKRSVSEQFGDGTLGQAHMAMAGLGFQCGFTGGKMACEKSIQADNCTLTWSVQMKASGGDVGAAGGEGFSRECS